MKTYSNWTDLEEHGVIMLTGEACAYGYRVLCDLEDKGIELVAECLGLPRPDLFKGVMADAWNTRGERCIMLAPQMFQPLCVFAAFASGCSKVFIMYSGTVVGIEPTDNPEHVEQWVQWNQGKFCEACSRYGAGGGIQWQYRNPGYSRNTHQMSGRTV